MAQDKSTSTCNQVSYHATTLDVIGDKLSNVEAYIIRKSVRQEIDDALLDYVKQEGELRASTISIRTTAELTHSKIIDTIQANWVGGDENNYPIAAYWQDKHTLFVQFADLASKDSFMFSPCPKECFVPIIEQVAEEDFYGFHFQRKPVKLEIPKVQATITVDKVEEMLKLLSGPRVEFSSIREGVPHKGNQSRSFLFTANARGIELLFGSFEGKLQYYDSDSGTKTNLYARINCRPYSCKQCHTLGHHECPGKRCAYCGSKEHVAKVCKQRIRFCVNCKKLGHRAKDIHCPKYISAIIKELKRFDLPLDLISDRQARRGIIKQIQMM